MAEVKKYDLVIVGAGPAGLAASIYASRYGIQHLVIGCLLGGQISETHLIDNYPGMEDMSGFEFAQKWGQHAKKYGTEILPAKVNSMGAGFPQGFEVNLESGDKIQAKTILLATGVKKRKLGVKGEEEFLGKGVSYCATCDGFFYKNKTVAVVGGSDSAAGATVYLADIAEKAYLIYRKDKLRAEPYWVNLIEKNPKIKVIYNTNIAEITGTAKVEKIKLDNSFENQSELAIDGIFIEAGSELNIDFAKDLGVALDEEGYIKINPDASTTLEGVWAAGDMTNGSDKFRQVLTAASEGAIAARSIYRFLKKQ